MTWYSLVLAEDIQHIAEEAWQLAWEVSQAESRHDHGSAIFKKVGPDGRLVLLFTPSSQLLAESFGATPCAKPPAQGLSLVAGSERARRIHFGRTFGLRQGMGAFRTFLRRVSHGRQRGPDEPPLNRHIRELFDRAHAAPLKGASMLVALAAWAEEHLSCAQMDGLQPALDALRRAEFEDPASLDALLEETEQQLAQAQSLHDAAWVLLREVAEWVPAARQDMALGPAAQRQTLL